MERRELGRSGLKVSAIGLGTFTWGLTTKPDDAAVQVRAYLDAGGNLIDTADVYAAGAAETIVGGLSARCSRAIRWCWRARPSGCWMAADPGRTHPPGICDRRSTIRCAG